MTTARCSLKFRMLQTEVIETLLYDCVTWTLNATHDDEFRKAHLELLRRVLDFQTPRPTKCESIEMNMRKRRLFFAAAMVR